MLKTVERTLLACETVLVWIAVLALIVLMFLTTADATFRYLFNSPITGAYEITEKYLITMGIFLAFSYAYRGDVFIRVSFLVDRFPPTAKLIVDYAAQLLTLGYCAFFAVSTLNEAINSMWEGSTLSAVPIPLAPSYFLVPLGFIAMGIMVLVDMPKVAKGQSRLMPPANETDASQIVT